MQVLIDNADDGDDDEDGYFSKNMFEDDVSCPFEKQTCITS